ncbi:hypothetical protein LIER_36485 [Lithospermum erythrorhizon]|uniref:Reverse transcriptase domain-containing protein n=1 Tax=Lithospermum erythrorhizon TaxID=34254 RepID=A0AAV3PAD4_LITER
MDLIFLFPMELRSGQEFLTLHSTTTSILTPTSPSYSKFLYKSHCDDQDGRDVLVSLERELDEALGEEEKYWQVRTKDKHLKEGDKNTRYFHASTMVRRRRNLLLSLEDDGGVYHEGVEKVEEIVLQYFSIVFGANQDTQLELATHLDSYNFLINGAPKDFIRPSRGIRQGDPLSPYLFLLCVEGLTCMLREFEERRALTGIKISRDSPSVSHILFGDGTIIFYKATVAEWAEIKRILGDYENLSGQKVIVGKCLVSFSTRTPTSIRETIVANMGIREVRDQGKYLGLPSQIGRTKKEIFRYIQSKVDSQIRGWKGKLLSQAGKEEMLKSENEEEDNGIHWKAWDKVCQDNIHEGLGFKDLECMNLALMEKQGWRVATHEASLLFKLLMGDGRSIDMWTKRWVPRLSDYKPRGARGNGPRWVSQLIQDNDWDRQGVVLLLGSEDAVNVLAIPLSRRSVRKEKMGNAAVGWLSILVGRLHGKCRFCLELNPLCGKPCTIFYQQKIDFVGRALVVDTIKVMHYRAAIEVIEGMVDALNKPIPTLGLAASPWMQIIKQLALQGRRHQQCRRVIQQTSKTCDGAARPLVGSR